MSSFNWPPQGGGSSGSPGDITETSFPASNNITSPTNVTGFIFGNTVRSFQALVSIYVNATSPLYEELELSGIQTGNNWNTSATGMGDRSGFNFDITNAGQITYTNNNYPGFTSATVKFRAITTAV